MTTKDNIKNHIINLRRQGKTYREIQNAVNFPIAKSTLSDICKMVVLTDLQKSKLSKKSLENLIKAREKSKIITKHKKQEKLRELLHKNEFLGNIIEQQDVAKVALVMLFLGEGSKTHTGTVMFGNSNPKIIQLFLSLFRKCYKTEEKKFRCTVQCRVGQDISDLKNYWSEVTSIPIDQFYKTQIDIRTAGKVLKNIAYKGVCRLDYLSADIVKDLQQSIAVIYNKGQ